MKRTSLAARLPIAALVLVAVASCANDDREREATPRTFATVVKKAPAPTVPAGWHTARVEGLTLAYPADFVRRTDAPGAALQVGIRFTGQPYPPPQLQVYVEKERVGPLEVREPLTKAQISQQLGGIKMPASTPVEVTGATAALQFTYDYRTEPATSTLDTPLEATDIRQSDLLVDVPGLPKYGVRYSAPADQYDPELWAQVIRSMSVDSQGTSQG